MKSSERKAHWQKVYEGKSPTEVSWFQTEPVISLELIHSCIPEADQPLIDVGGGASVLVDRLVQAGYSRISVLDISSTALAAARARLGASATQVEWIETDITGFRPHHEYALWHDRAVFHFLTEPEDRIQYIKTLNKAVKPGGYVVIAAFAIGGPEMCSGLPIIQYDAEKLLTEIGGGFQLLEERTELHLTPANKTQKFAYFRLLKV
jgi:2-polyprenyl-3-methyl-5-hydroxy-6-metoxy-1,4-benzoquinol methylase